MSSIVSFLFNIIPESNFKNKLRCKIYNRKSHDFRIEYHENLFIVDFGEFELKFEQNPYYLLLEQPQYFKYTQLHGGDTVIDAGGFWGTFALYAALRVGYQGRVVVIEPDPKNYKILMRHIALNNVENITVINKGLWSSCTKLQFISKGDLGSTFVDLSKEENSNEDIESVETTTLDKVAVDLNIDHVNFIKMDIEGAEIEALKGAEKILSKKETKLSIASYHIVEDSTTSKRVEDVLTEYGYKPFTETNLETITYA